jgi:hypothetical protein
MALPFSVIARSAATKQSTFRHSGMVRKHQTSDVLLHSGNLEIPGSMLRIAPE